MKKFIYLALLATTMSFGQTTVKNTVETAINDTKQQVEQTTSEIKNVSGEVAKTAQQGKATLSTVYGDGKDGVKAIYGDISSLGGEAKSAIKSIVQEVKEISGKAWLLLVRQQMIWSLCFLAITLSSLILGYKFFNQFKFMINDLNETGDVKERNIPLTFIYGLLFAGAAYASAIHFEPMMTGFFNPEFGALRTLVELGKNIK